MEARFHLEKPPIADKPPGYHTDSKTRLSCRHRGPRIPDLAVQTQEGTLGLGVQERGPWSNLTMLQ